MMNTITNTMLCRLTLHLFVSLSLSFSSGNLNVRFWKRDLYLTGTVRSGRKLFNYNLKNSPAQSSKGGRTPNENRCIASRHVFKIRTHCFLCVYAHRKSALFILNNIIFVSNRCQYIIPRYHCCKIRYKLVLQLE